MKDDVNLLTVQKCLLQQNIFISKIRSAIKQLKAHEDSIVIYRKHAWSPHNYTNYSFLCDQVSEVVLLQVANLLSNSYIT